MSTKDFVDIMSIFIKGFLFMAVGFGIIVVLDRLGILPPPPWLWS